jgi:hypothetical protein
MNFVKPEFPNTHVAFSRKGRHPLLLSHLDVVLPQPMTRLIYRFAVSSKLAPPLSLQSKMAYR